MGNIKGWMVKLAIITVIIAACAVIVGLSAVPDVESLRFVEESLELDVKSVRNLIPIVMPREADESKVTYHSGDKSIVEYENGLLIANSVGECAVYATCDGVISNVIKVTVRDYAAEAASIRDEIDEYYSRGDMSAYRAAWLYSRYITLPEYARSIVENAWVMLIYKDYKPGDPAVYVTKSGEKYHAYADCPRARNSTAQVPLLIALHREMEPCAYCGG